MKQQVILSKYSLIITVAGSALLIGLMFFNNPPAEVQISLGIMLGILALASLLYMPLSISANKTAIYINRSLRIKVIPMPDVASVKMCAPTMGQSAFVPAAVSLDTGAGSRSVIWANILPTTAVQATASL